MPVIDLTKGTTELSADALLAAAEQAGAGGTVVVPASALLGLTAPSADCERLFTFAERTLLMGMQAQIRPDEGFAREMVRVGRSILSEIATPTEPKSEPTEEE